MASFEAYEQFLKEATTGPNRTLPGVVVAAIDATGITYSHASGTQSIDDKSPLVNKPFSLDTTMWIASCTKLLTSLAALQCVDRGLLTADGDISEHIPELAKMPILTGFKTEGDQEVPQFKENTTPITLRHLLSHSSGLGYAAFDPDLQKLYKHLNINPDINDSTFFTAIFTGALKFEPGTAWTYGVGIDIAGLAIERVTKMSLGEYFKKEFFEPLGMTSTSFRLTDAIKAERSDMALRDPIGGKVMHSQTRLIGDEVAHDMGGAGLWSCARDYTKVLSAVLQKPCPLFKKQETLEMAFQPCLTKESKDALNFVLFGTYPGNEDNAIGSMFHGGSLPASGTEVDYTMAGLSVINGMEGKRGGAGKAVSWGGLPNLLWCIDREKGKAVFYGSQILPPADKLSGAAFAKFEAFVFGQEGAKL